MGDYIFLLWCCYWVLYENFSSLNVHCSSTIAFCIILFSLQQCFTQHEHQCYFLSKLIPVSKKRHYLKVYGMFWFRISNNYSVKENKLLSKRKQNTKFCWLIWLYFQSLLLIIHLTHWSGFTRVFAKKVSWLLNYDVVFRD